MLTANGPFVAPPSRSMMMFLIQICAASEVAKDCWTSVDLITAPESGGFAKASAAELTVVQVEMGKTLDDWPCSEEAMPRILDPPQARPVIADDLHGTCDQLVRLGQSSWAAGRHGGGVLCTWWAGCHHVKVAHWIGMLVLPLQDVLFDVGLP